MDKNDTIILDKTLDIIAKNVRHFRTKKDLSQEDLGLKSGISSNYITDIENAKRDLHISTLTKISEALDIDCVELFVKRESYLNKERIDKK